MTTKTQREIQKIVRKALVDAGEVSARVTDGGYMLRNKMPVHRSGFRIYPDETNSDAVIVRYENSELIPFRMSSIAGQIRISRTHNVIAKRYANVLSEHTGLRIEAHTSELRERGYVVCRMPKWFQGRNMANLIVTWHKPLVEWLKQHGITGDVIEQATPDDIRGKDVYGILPLHLASIARTVTEVSMPLLTLEQRKKNAAGDLTVEEMDAAGAHLRRFIIKELHSVKG